VGEREGVGEREEVGELDLAGWKGLKLKRWDKSLPFCPYWKESIGNNGSGRGKARTLFLTRKHVGFAIAATGYELLPSGLALEAAKTGKAGKERSTLLKTCLHNTLSGLLAKNMQWEEGPLAR